MLNFASSTFASEPRLVRHMFSSIYVWSYSEYLKCMLVILNILLKSKINISLCTDQISQIIPSSGKLFTAVFIAFI